MKNTFVLLLVVLSVIFYCCKDDVIQTTPDPVCDQKCKDEYTAFAISDIFIRIWNTNIANRYQVGQTVNIDTTVAGPNGGTIKITGQIEIHSTEYSSFSLNYRMNDCNAENSGYSLIFTLGVINIFGEMTNTTKNLTYRCDDIKFYGTVALNQAQSVPVFEEGCGIDFYETITSRSGTICTRQFP